MGSEDLVHFLFYLELTNTVDKFRFGIILNIDTTTPKH
jgi:hypothetical protein